MKIVYKNTKILPNDQLHQLFMSIGWSDGKEDRFKLNNFNEPFKNSTIVISAWDDEKLVGCIRAISDKVVRSVIQDLAILPEYQNKKIGQELLNRCINYFPKSEWLICTDKKHVKFYEKNGFKRSNCEFLIIPSKWFKYKDN